jgi:hypothetical protein
MFVKKFPKLLFYKFIKKWCRFDIATRQCFFYILQIIFTTITEWVVKKIYLYFCKIKWKLKLIHFNFCIVFLNAWVREHLDAQINLRRNCSRVTFDISPVIFLKSTFAGILIEKKYLSLVFYRCHKFIIRCFYKVLIILLNNKNINFVWYVCEKYFQSKCASKFNCCCIIFEAQTSKKFAAYLIRSSLIYFFCYRDNIILFFDCSFFKTFILPSF